MSTFDLCFLYRCNLGKDEIKQYFEKGGPEAYESTGILFFSQEVDFLYLSNRMSLKTTFVV